jgi:hypothetical protein
MFCSCRIYVYCINFVIRMEIVDCCEKHCASISKSLRTDPVAICVLKIGNERANPNSSQ